MDTLLLSARNLGRADQKSIRLADFNLELHQGEVIGLLGVNGAGKSTTLALLSGALAPSNGYVEVLGRNLHQHPQAKRHIGLLPEQPPLYPNLSVDENLDFTAQLRGLRAPRIRTAREKVKRRLDLTSLGRRLCGRLSKGMAQRVAIAQALIHAPAILILDEPTAGLDPTQAQELRELIRTLASESGILLASHILTDIEQLCQRVVILNQGHQVAEQALDGGGMVRIRLGAPPDDPARLKTIAAIQSVQDQENGWYLLELCAPEETLAQQVVAAGWELQALIPAQYNLQALLTEAINNDGEHP